MSKIIAVRGGGDLATGVAHKLKKCGFDVVILEIPSPTVIRRTVSFASAVFEGAIEVEGITGRLASSMDDIRKTIGKGEIPVIVDPEGEYIGKLNPFCLVDCILAKKNIGTKINSAPIVIGVGPGFFAGKDVHAVVESMRGHDLGRVINEGKAHEDTGEPGNIGGYTYERIIRAVADGTISNKKQIADEVKAGDIIAVIDEKPVVAEIDGIIRGLIYNGSIVHKNLKIGDIDPRASKAHCFTISDKARAIGGGVLEAVLYLENQLRCSRMCRLEESKC